MVARARRNPLSRPEERRPPPGQGEQTLFNQRLTIRGGAGLPLGQAGRPFRHRICKKKRGFETRIGEAPPTERDPAAFIEIAADLPVPCSSPACPPPRRGRPKDPIRTWSLPR